MKIAEALRLLRNRKGLTQKAATEPEGTPDYRTLSHWETKRKLPSMRVLGRYLQALGYNFADLQEALDVVEGRPPRQVPDGYEEVRKQLAELQRRLEQVEEFQFTIMPSDG